MSYYIDLQKAAEYAAQDVIKFADEDEEMRALQQFHEEVTPEKVLALLAENEALRKSLSEAADEIESWGAYASEYFQQKHGLAGSVSRIRAAAQALSMENQRITPVEPLRVPHPLDAAMGKAVQP